MVDERWVDFHRRQLSERQFGRGECKDYFRYQTGYFSIEGGAHGNGVFSTHTYVIAKVGLGNTKFVLLLSGKYA